jgi:hypothetical protein
MPLRGSRKCLSRQHGAGRTNVRLARASSFAARGHQPSSLRSLCESPRCKITLVRGKPPPAPAFSAMKPLAGVVLSAAYVLAAYAFMHLCLAVLRPFELTPGAAVEWQGVAYVALSTVAAATVCVGIYIWQLGNLSIAHAIALGLLALIMQEGYELLRKSWSDLASSLSEHPWHSAATALVIAASIPVVAAVFAHHSFRRTRIDTA